MWSCALHYLTSMQILSVQAKNLVNKLKKKKREKKKRKKKKSWYSKHTHTHKKRILWTSPELPRIEGGGGGWKLGMGLWSKYSSIWVVFVVVGFGFFFCGGRLKFVCVCTNFSISHLPTPPIFYAVSNLDCGRVGCTPENCMGLWSRYSSVWVGSAVLFLLLFFSFLGGGGGAEDWW